MVTRRDALVRLGGLAIGAAGIGLVGPRAFADGTEVMVYRSPTCGCCLAWAEHLRHEAFAVSLRELDDLSPVKARLGVPADLQGCHTATVGGYVVEGHVPTTDIKRLLAARPAARGLAVPGMPIGSPGMEQGARKDPYRVILFGDAGRSVFASYLAAEGR